jgi:GNAT superfamily N-acetyltransferase
MKSGPSTHFEQSEAYTVQIMTPGEQNGPILNAQIEALFLSGYNQYHFKWKLFDEQRYRYVCRQKDGQLIGFATVESLAQFAVLANLLVAPGQQGKGLGYVIEAARAELVNELGLIPYSSCVTFGTASQKLKAKFDMQPINWKLGNRINVIEPNNVSSAITYLGPIDRCQAIDTCRIERDNANDRFRLISCDQAHFNEHVADLLWLEDSYVDILVHPAVIVGERFVPQGIDIDVYHGRWGRLWQLDNRIRALGLSGSLDLFTPLDSIMDIADRIAQHLG